MNAATKKGIGAITIVLSVIGGVTLLGTAATAAVAGVHRIGPQSGDDQVDAAGITDLDLEVHGAEVSIDFHDADTAELRVEGGSIRDWRLRRDGDELVVRGPRADFGWLGWWTPDWVRSEDQRVTLVLPRSAAGLDADLTLNAGTLSADGEFGELDVTVNAGGLTLLGSAESLDAELNAGRADITLDGVDEASYQVSAGRVDAELTGTAPRGVEIEVSAGALNLTVPAAEYDLRRNVSAGSLDSELAEQRGSGNRISATVSAGSVNLREG